MPLDRLISTKLTQSVRDDTSPTSSTTIIVSEDRVWAELLDNRAFSDIFRGLLVSNSKAIYRVRYVDWIVNAPVSRLDVTDPHGDFIGLDAIREDASGGRRRFLILEGEAI